MPVRFVRACIKGHVGDIDWRGFVHRFAKVCLMDLWLEQRGTTGDLSELWVICECGDKRCLLEAAETDTHPLGNCNGSRPWFDDRDPNSCNEFNRLLQRNASNAYFARLLPVISIPDSVAAVDKVVLEDWVNFFFFDESLEDVARERKRPERLAKLEEGFQKWLKNHEGNVAVFPGAAYVMLHSLSHLLVTAISLECGYPASSMRERIFKIRLSVALQ